MFPILDSEPWAFRIGFSSHWKAKYMSSCYYFLFGLDGNLGCRGAVCSIILKKIVGGIISSFGGDGEEFGCLLYATLEPKRHLASQSNQLGFRSKDTGRVKKTRTN